MEIRDYIKVAEIRGIPDYMQQPLAKYIVEGHPVGDFLTAVLSNSFTDAFLLADEANTVAMKDWAAFMYWDCPSNCRGSKEKVKEWIKIGGLTGFEEPIRERSEQDAKV